MPTLRNQNMMTVLRFLVGYLVTWLIIVTIDGGVITFIETMQYSFRENEHYILVFGVRGLFILLLYLCYISSRKTVRTVAYIFTFLFFTVALTNYFINGLSDTQTFDYNVAAVIGNEIGISTFQFISFFYLSLLKGLGLSLLAVVFLSIFLKRVAPRISWWSISPLPAIIIPVIVLAFIKGGFIITLMPTPYKIPALFYLVHIQQPYRGEREQVSLHSSNEKRSFNKIIFVVDESARGDLFGINQPKIQSTPFLNSIENEIYNFGICVSAANCSMPSNLILQTGIRSNELPDKNYRMFKMPNIFQYAKAAGYKTFFITAQGTAGQYLNNMSAYDFKSIDHSIYIRSAYPDLERPYYDEKIVEVLQKISKENKRFFAYVIKAGVHFPYTGTYPKHYMEGKTYNVDTDPKIDDLNAKPLKESYIKGIEWNVDGFFRAMNQLKGDNVLLIYTSDHGQGLHEYYDPSTHCKSKNPVKYQGIVPLLIIPYSNQVKLKIDPLVMGEFVANKNRASHFQIFPTLLLLFGYDVVGTKMRYGNSLFDKPNEKRHFFSGDLFGNSNLNENSIETPYLINQ